MYQHGEIYTKGIRNANGSAGGDYKILAPGIRLSAVLPLDKGKYLVPRLVAMEDDHLEIT